MEGDLFSNSSGDLCPISYIQYSHFRLQSKAEAAIFFREDFPQNETLVNTPWAMSFGLEVSSPLPESPATYILFKTATFSIGVVPYSTFKSASLTVTLGNVTTETLPLNWDLGRRYEIEVVVSGGVHLLRDGELVAEVVSLDNLMIDLSRGINKGTVDPADSVSFQVTNLDFILGVSPLPTPPDSSNFPPAPTPPGQPREWVLPLVYFSALLFLIGSFWVVCSRLSFSKSATPNLPPVNPDAPDQADQPHSRNIDAIDWV